MSIALVLSLIFSPLAAMMAFLITYDDYRRHFPERGRALRAGFEAAALTFAVFLLLSVGAILLMERMAKW
jgi:hypothetical protein